MNASLRFHSLFSGRAGTGPQIFFFCVCILSVISHTATATSKGNDLAFGSSKTIVKSQTE